MLVVRRRPIQGRSVVFVSRYAQVAPGKRAGKARGGSGGMLPQKNFILGGSEVPFPMFFIIET